MGLAYACLRRAVATGTALGRSSLQEGLIFQHTMMTSPSSSSSNGGGISPLTTSEYIASLSRICGGAFDGLTVTPLPAILGGAFAIFSVGVYESTLWLTNMSAVARDVSAMSKYRYMLRYGTHQIIPSLVWETQPASIIAQRVGLSQNNIYTDPSTLQRQNPKNYLRYIRSVSIRGAIAGSVLLSQVVSLVNIGREAQAGYVRRIRQGREPPLDVYIPDEPTKDKSIHPGHQGVVVRLAGEDSDVTTQSMAIEGRRRIFPIFEDANRPNVQALVQDHGCPIKRSGSGSTTTLSDEPRVPIYWNVKNGRYGKKDSWRGLKIPSHWLFDVALTAKGVREHRPSKLLILEADATSGESDSLSLKRKKSTELDLDLYEVAQGFHNLQKCVDAPKGSFDTMRVLLVDSEVLVRKGGGYSVKGGSYVRVLSLADVIVDAREPLIFAMTKWLERVSESGILPSSKGLFRRKSLRPVILETPNEEWFESMRSEFALLGYEIISFVEALKRYGIDGASQTPMFVYEKSISDTTHTIKRLKEKGFVREDMVCALFPHHLDREEMAAPEYATICSTDLYNHLLLWVRKQALRGHIAGDIQKRLDEDLRDILTM